MKKTICIFMTFVQLFITATCGSAHATIYAPDGRTAVVDADMVEEYLALGWYDSSSDAQATIYAPDGRTATVFKAEVPAYLSLGWYASYEDAVKQLYAPDGRSVTVYKAEVPSYLALGWYENYEETVEAIYAPGKAPALVYKAEVPTYLSLGWKRIRDLRPMIALTFDDGPHGTYTDAVLNTLEKYNAKATFFVLGSQAEKYSAQLRRAYALGCDIGNHTYIHPNLNAVASGRVSSEIGNTNQIVQNAIGISPKFLRPPYGNHNAQVRKIGNMPVVLWNVDPQDWNHKSASEIANHIINYAFDGSIVLLHDIYPSTAEALEIIVPALQDKGYRLVTVSELAEAKGYSLEQGKVYYGF